MSDTRRWSDSIKHNLRCVEEIEEKLPKGRKKITCFAPPRKKLNPFIEHHLMTIWRHIQLITVDHSRSPGPKDNADDQYGPLGDWFFPLSANIFLDVKYFLTIARNISIKRDRLLLRDEDDRWEECVDRLHYLPPVSPSSFVCLSLIILNEHFHGLISVGRHKNKFNIWPADCWANGQTDCLVCVSQKSTTRIACK